MPTSLFRDRDFSLLFGGETISELGSNITYLAFPLIAVAVLHASAFAVGAITAAGNAAWLVVALPAGVWIDRLRRRPILIGVDIASAALLATVPLAWAFDDLSVAQLAIVGFGIGALSVVFDIAYPAFVPGVVPADRLVAANGALEASTNGARLLGPGLGGILVQTLGAPVTLLADAASFLVSAATLGAMRAHETKPTPLAQRPRFAAEIAGGLRYSLGTPSLRALTVGVTVGNLVFGAYGAVVVLFLNRQLGLHAGVIGVLFSVGGIGGIVGSLIAAPAAARIGDARLIWLSTLLASPFLLMVPLTSGGAGLAWFVVGSGMFNIGLAAFNVCARSAIQRSAPRTMLGRVTASMRVFSRGSLPVGALLGGALAGAFTPRTALAVSVACFVIAPLWLFASPIGRVRTVDELSQPVEPQAADGGSLVGEPLPAGVEPLAADVESLPAGVESLAADVESLAAGVESQAGGVESSGAGVESLVTGVGRQAAGVESQVADSESQAVDIESQAAGVDAQSGVALHVADVEANGW